MGWLNELTMVKSYPSEARVKMGNSNKKFLKEGNASKIKMTIISLSLLRYWWGPVSRRWLLLLFF